MRKLIHRVTMFAAREDGPTATEYAVMLTLIIVVAITAITALGERVSAIFSEATTLLGG